MKPTLLLFCVAGAVAAQAQTAHKPASTAAKTTVHHTAVAHPAGSASAAVKLPPGVPAVAAPVKTAFSLRYQDIKVGTGADAVPYKLYKVLYTGYRAADGIKFDSSDDHRQPVMDKDGKPEMDANGKPKMGAPEPLAFPQGMGRLIPGFDQGFIGMKVGGKRRLFIPWQLAYGTRELPDRPDHPGIPAKSDLIFDVELVGIDELPMPPNHPGGAGAPGAGAPGAAPHGAPGSGAPTGSAAPAPAPSTAPTPQPRPADPAQPAPTPQQ